MNRAEILGRDVQWAPSRRAAVVLGAAVYRFDPATPAEPNPGVAMLLQSPFDRA